MVEQYKKWESQITTADGLPRAVVPFTGLQTLWLNTGTVCNLACENCYIESSPTNDSLIYLSLEDVSPFIREIKDLNWKVNSINITGGEPFINPHIFPIIEHLLESNFRVLTLTNAVIFPDMKLNHLRTLNEKFKGQLDLRISLDHYTKEIHEKERGIGSFEKTMKNFKKLDDMGISISIAGRSLIEEDIEHAKKGYQALLDRFEISIVLDDNNLIIFPEMETNEDVPEITSNCFKILNIRPSSLMCSSERMIVRRKYSKQASVLACTLIAYDKQFELGHTLEESYTKVHLNHLFCATFCVLGGASCSG